MASVTAEAHGPLSRFARQQYAALASMRWTMFRNGVRSFRGAAELASRIFVGALFGGIGLGVAVGLGTGAYAIITHHQWRFFPALFWGIFFLWQMIPITVASFQQQFEFGNLLRFPVSFGTFFLLSLVTGAADISSLLGVLCCLGLFLGIAFADPHLLVAAALVLAAFAFFNLLLSRMVFAWVERWLAQRRTREIASAVLLCAVLAMNFFNPAFRKSAGTPNLSPEARAAAQHSLHVANQVQQWLPAGAAAAVIQSAAQSRATPLVTSSGLFGVYILLCGAGLAIRLRAAFSGEDLGEAPARQTAERRTRPLLLNGSGPIAAMMEKELRIILRAVNLLYALGAPLLFVFIFAGLFKNKGGGHFSHLPWGFFACLAYAVVGFTQLIYNNLGTEGEGLQLYYLSPTPLRTVLLAKNLFHGLLFCVDAGLVLLLASLRYGSPDPIALAATGAWALFALPVHLTVGNLLSATMPYRLIIGQLGRQKGSQANALISMAIQIGVLGIGAGVLVLCGSYAHQLWLAPPVFLLLGAIATVVWMRSLSGVERILYRRRDDLFSALVRAD